MAHKFPSQEWTAAYKEAVNQNTRYREAGKDWTHGAVAMIVSADPSIGLQNDVGMVLDVHQGICRSTKYIEGAQAVQEAPFVIVSDYGKWKQVIQGELEPIKAMMQGKLKLTKGHLPTIIKYVEASRQLVVCASQVPTQFIG